MFAAGGFDSGRDKVFSLSSCPVIFLIGQMRASRLGHHGGPFVGVSFVRSSDFGGLVWRGILRSNFNFSNGMGWEESLAASGKFLGKVKLFLIWFKKLVEDFLSILIDFVGMELFFWAGGGVGLCVFLASESFVCEIFGVQLDLVQGDVLQVLTVF